MQHSNHARYVFRLQPVRRWDTNRKAASFVVGMAERISASPAAFGI
jgi:hypothetical protein